MSRVLTIFIKIFNYQDLITTMPALQKFHANVTRHVKLMDKNLCASVIRHEHIVTTRSKAKRAQVKVERFLADALKANSSIKDKEVMARFRGNAALNYLQPPDKKEVGFKVIEELADRYPRRQTGFTRVIKLEPRLGEDKAPMSVLELVDSDYEIKFWFTAKIVARLEIQDLPLDDITKVNVQKLTQFRNDGENKFREAVETAKVEFFKYDSVTGVVADQEIAENLKNVPQNLEFNGGDLAGSLTKSKRFLTKPRATTKEVNIPASPFVKN